MVSYRAQRPSHLWHILPLITPVIMCVIIDLMPVLAPMPMPYYIFPNAFSGPKNKFRRGDVSSAPASLLHLRSRPPPCSAVLLCVLCALGRGPVREGVAAGWRASHCRCGLHLPPALVPTTVPEPPVPLTRTPHPGRSDLHPMADGASE